MQANVPPSPWAACNEYSTPDTQPGYWGIDATASHGATYISLFTRGTGGFLNDGINEAIGTPLLKPLRKDSCYIFSIDLSFFSKATFTGSWGEFIEYKSPTTLRIYGGTSPCEKGVTLYHSLPIFNEQWQTYSFSVTPNQDVSYLTLEANFVDGNIQFGCLLLDNMKIQAFNISLGCDRIICNDNEITLQPNIETGNFLWSTGATGKSIQVAEPGQYSVTVTAEGCSATDMVSVSHSPPLTFDLGEDKILCLGEKIILDASSEQANYSWSTGESTASITVINSGVYEVTVTNSCESARDQVQITMVKEDCCSVIVPNVFTPNNDGINDFFETASPSTPGQFYIKIYNRWGAVIFESNDINTRWDGNAKTGAKAAAGVYFWISSMTCTYGDVTYENALRGTVTLLR